MIPIGYFRYRNPLFLVLAIWCKVYVRCKGIHRIYRYTCGFICYCPSISRTWNDPWMTCCWNHTGASKLAGDWWWSTPHEQCQAHPPSSPNSGCILYLAISSRFNQFTTRWKRDSGKDPGVHFQTDKVGKWPATNHFAVSNCSSPDTAEI